MSSKKLSETTSPEIDLPTTDRDIEALRRARSAGVRPLAEVFARLSRLELVSTRKRTTSKGWEAFVLD